ncbi:hypothetical protein LSTR_LSTR005801 [Laodelphax striatellus]|uniref:Uncharacterized protein n=1 Tax=Laodelphax striatellus TaxID=195883 RepID=A0A482X0C9_LAOST|nr:hypothetical protein LSTR_LSTR005801 [Laodelphax striatellus]
MNKEAQYDKMFTNNTMPHTSFHLSIPEAMEQLQNKITMTSNFENQEFKVILELNKDRDGAPSSPKSSNGLDCRVKSSINSGVSRGFEQKISKAVNTEPTIENVEMPTGRSKVFNDGKLKESQGVAGVVDQEVSQIVFQQPVDWETKSHDLAELRQRVEGLESTLSSTVGVVLEKLSPKGPSTSEKHVGISCKMDQIRSSECQTDFEFMKPTKNIHQSKENQVVQKTTLADEINKILHINRGGAENNYYKQSVDSSTTNQRFLQRKYRTQSSSSQSSSLVSIPRLSASEEKSLSELSEGEVALEAAICSCSFGEIKMSGCLRCGPYGVKKLTMKRSYPNVQKSDGEMSVKNVQRSSSDHSGSQSVDSCTNIRLDMKRESRTVLKFKSKSLSQTRVTASKSFTNVVENIMDELKKEKMEARMKFKRSQENFDAQFLKHSECLRRSDSEISLRMASSVLNLATMSSSKNYSSKNIPTQSFYNTVSGGSNKIFDNPQLLPMKPESSSMEIVSDESVDSEVAIEKLQELDSCSLFRLIRKRKDRQLHAKHDQKQDKSDEKLVEKDDRIKSKFDSDRFTGKSGTVPDLKEIGPATGEQTIEEALKTFFSSTVSSEHEPGRTQDDFCEGESSLIRTRKDLLDTDSCNSTILTNTSEDRDRSEGQIEY